MQAANDLSPASGDSAASSRQSLGNLSLNTFTPAGEDYVIFNLSNENKSKLLEASVEESKKSQADAEATLSSLRQICPELSEAFELSNAAIDQLVLRMILPGRSALVSDPAKHVPSFIVLSYAWQSQAFQIPDYPPCLPPWPLSKSMVQRIMNLRAHPDEGIWIDALCIDQENEVEKKIAIGSMDIIYNSARQMLILLEDIILSGDEDLFIWRRAGAVVDMALNYQSFTDKNGNTDGARMVEVLINLLKLTPADYTILNALCSKIRSARWFTRSWCHHEFRVHPHFENKGLDEDALFLMYREDGTVCTLSWSLFSLFHQLCSFGQLDTSQETASSGISAGARVARLASKSPVQRGYEAGSFSLVKELFLLDSCTSCSVISDIVSVVLNLCGIGLYFKGSVYTLDDCYYKISALAIAAGDLSALSQKGPWLQRRIEGQWVNSWMRRPFCETTKPISYQPLSTAHGIKSISHRSVTLDLLVIEKTMACLWGSPRALAVCDLLFKCGMSPHLGDFIYTYGSFRVRTVQKGSTNLQWTTLRSFIASSIDCILDCGMNWLVDALAAVETPASLQFIWADDPTPKPPAPSLRPAATLLLDILGEDETDLVAFRARYFDALHKYLTYLSDPRFRVTLVGGSIIPVGRTSRALGPSFWSRYTLAVPIALNSSPWVDNVIWHLEPYDEAASPGAVIQDQSWRDDMRKIQAQGRDQEGASLTNQPWVYEHMNLPEHLRHTRLQANGRGTWRVVDRSCALGLPRPLVADGEFVTLRRDQMVYG